MLEDLALILGSSSCFQLPAYIDPRKQQLMIQVTGSLPPTREIWIE